MSLDLVPYEVMVKVARVLLEKATRSIHFTIEKYSVSRHDYETLAVHIYLGDIQVAYGTLTDMAETGGVAYYQGGSVDGRSDILYVPQAFGEDVLSRDARSVVIHEATHAVFDARRIAMRRLDAEMLAYFAQFWYSMANGLDLLVTGRKLGTDLAIIGYGFDCVRQYKSTGRIDRQNLEDFRKAILAMPLYGDAERKMSAADGVTDLPGRVTDPQLRRDVLSRIRGDGGLSDPY